MPPLPRRAAGRAFIAMSSDGAVRMVLSSVFLARQLSLPQLRSFAAPVTAGICASVAALFCEAAANQIWFHTNSESPHFGGGSFRGRYCRYLAVFALAAGHRRIAISLLTGRIGSHP
jgi:hypothetical protein